MCPDWDPPWRASNCCFRFLRPFFNCGGVRGLSSARSTPFSCSCSVSRCLAMSPPELGAKTGSATATRRSERFPALAAHFARHIEGRQGRWEGGQNRLRSIASISLGNRPFWLMLHCLLRCHLLRESVATDIAFLSGGFSQARYPKTDAATGVLAGGPDEGSPPDRRQQGFSQVRAAI